MDQPDGGPGADSGTTPKASASLRPIRRRNRMINSCLECRKRKLKCSKTSPSCMNCVKAGRDCLYIGPRLDEASQLRLAEIKEKQGSLERQLERDVAKSTTSKNALRQRIVADEVADEYDEVRDLEATPLAALDLTYDDDADGADDMIDLGIQIGKMRITERIGGLSRPRISEEISTGLTGQPRAPGPGYRGPPPVGQSPGLGPSPGLDAASDAGASDVAIPDYLRPSAQYIAPTSGLFFGQVVDQPSLVTFLPYRVYADRFLRQYLLSVHPIAPCAHRPSLEKTYAAFWDEVEAGYEPRPSIQAIVFAAMFSGAVSMSEFDALREFGGFAKENWVHSLKIGTETALSKANFLRTTNMETMQAFIMYMLPLCRAEVSRAHSVLVGAAVRMAECMGLHRDGQAYGLTPLETHVRCLVWHQLCFLDIRTCEAQGPKPAIRREDYDTKLPINCDEEALTHAVEPPEPADRWTSNTMALIRFEINEMMRIIWLDRRRLETRRLTLAAVLTKIENFRRRMSEKYDHLLDVAQPVQRYAKCVMYLLTYRLHVMVLHPYHSNAAHPMPARLSSLLITSGVMIVELAIQLETNPVFQPWSWYLGAYFQYQIALLLATEVYYRPQAREADRIWACLDYVFGMDRRLPPEAKGLHILSEIQGKTAVYMRMRKMRGPTNTARASLAHNVVAGTGQSPPSPSLGGLPGDPTAAAAARAKLEEQQQQPPHHRQQQHHHHHAPLAPNGLPGMPPGPPPPAPVPGPPGMVFGGISDGQALWGFPPSHASPGSSDTSSVGQMSDLHGLNPDTPAAPQPVVNIMENIDWDTINALFHNDPQTGGLSVQGYHDPNSLFWMGLHDVNGG